MTIDPNIKKPGELARAGLDRNKFAPSIVPRTSAESVSRHGNDLACPVDENIEIQADNRILSTNDRWQPLPVDALPELMREYIEQGADALGCDPTMIALPMVTACAVAIGNARRIEPKASWREPAILWAANVAESGSLKSPAMDLGTRHLQKLQKQTHYLNADAMRQFEIDTAIYEKAISKWRHNSGDGAPPEKPAKPKQITLTTDDATTEALAALLSQNPRGLGLFNDELSGLFGSMDRYVGSKGGDIAKYLAWHGGRQSQVHRKTSGTIFIPRASLSICGTIQPPILRQCLRPEFFSNGFAARFLLAAPPVKPKRWSEKTVDPALDLLVEEMFINLYGLAGDLGSSADEMVPVNLRMDDSAKSVWIDFYNAHAREQAKLCGDLGAAWSKLEGYAARLALVIHCVRQAAGERVNPNLIDLRSIESGITLSRWFGNEARRLYRQFGESPEQTQRRELVDLIGRQGGSITPRNLSRMSRQFGSVDLAERALIDLQQAGLVDSENTAPDGPGRPGVVFRLRLTDPAIVDKNTENPEKTAILSTTAGGWQEVKP